MNEPKDKQIQRRSSIMKWWQELMHTGAEQIAIPPLFRDSVTKQPHEECLLCKTPLKNKAYRVNKLLRKYPDFDFTETILEIAICHTCATKPTFKISEESKAIILKFYEQVDFIGRVYDMYHTGDKMSYQSWIDRCLITNKKRNQISDYQVMACISEKNKLILNEELFMISGQAIETLSEQLSVETKRELDDFTGQHFGVPPELLSKDRPKLILV